MKNIRFIIITFLVLSCTRSESQEISFDSLRVINIEVFKYDYSVTGIRLKYNDTITVISNKSDSISHGSMIKLNGIYCLKLSKMISDTIFSSTPTTNFRLRAKDKRTLWESKQNIEFIPYKALNLDGLHLSPN